MPAQPTTMEHRCRYRNEGRGAEVTGTRGSDQSDVSGGSWEATEGWRVAGPVIGVAGCGRVAS